MRNGSRSRRPLGLVPADTDLAPRNPGVDAWDDCPRTTASSRRACRRRSPAFLDHTDAQIGRLIDELEERGELDNTMIVLLSDNGASQEGGPFGVLHEWKFFNFIIETPDEAIHRLDDIGGPNSHSNYPWGWAQAGNTPFKWYKQNTHEGGVHVPLHRALAGAARRRPALRHQFHHVSDIVPTDLRGPRRHAARACTAASSRCPSPARRWSRASPPRPTRPTREGRCSTSR